MLKSHLLISEVLKSLCALSCGFVSPSADMIHSWQTLVAPEARAQVHCLGRELAGGSPAGPWVSLGTDRVPTVSTICSYEGCLTASSQGPGRWAPLRLNIRLPSPSSCLWGCMESHFNPTNRKYPHMYCFVIYQEFSHRWSYFILPKTLEDWYWLTLFHREVKWHPKVTQLASGRIGIQTKFLTIYYYIKCSTAASFKDLQKPFLKSDPFKLC